MNPTPILTMLGLLLSAGFVAGHLAERYGIPRVATYVLVGALFSQALLGRFLGTGLAELDPLLIDAALGAVAFLIGGELNLRRLRTLRSAIGGGTVGQSFGAFIFVAGSLYLYALFTQQAAPLATALVLAAIATATAPAATLAVIEEYRTRGPLTTTLLGVVAVDDALSIILFSLVVGVAAGGEHHDLLSALREIAGALLLGSATGALLGWFGRRVASEDLRLPVIAGSILLAVGLASWLEFSSLLTCMMLGLVSKQLFGSEKSHQWLRPMIHIQELIFLTLFTVAGTHFQPGVFVNALGFISIYAVARVLGKIIGAWLGTRFATVPTQVHRYLGLTLLPQAGVSIGLALIASNTPGLEETGTLIVNTILGTTIIFEVLAPILAKIALTRAGERTDPSPEPAPDHTPK